MGHKSNANNKKRTCALMHSGYKTVLNTCRTHMQAKLQLKAFLIIAGGIEKCLTIARAAMVMPTVSASRFEGASF